MSVQIAARQMVELYLEEGQGDDDPGRYRVVFDPWRFICAVDEMVDCGDSPVGGPREAKTKVYLDTNGEVVFVRVPEDPDVVGRKVVEAMKVDR